jgi:hypothetical protein
LLSSQLKSTEFQRAECAFEAISKLKLRERDAGGCHHHAGSEASGLSGKEEVKGATGITEADEIPEQPAND